MLFATASRLLLVAHGMRGRFCIRLCPKVVRRRQRKNHVVDERCTPRGLWHKDDRRPFTTLVYQTQIFHSTFYKISPFKMWPCDYIWNFDRNSNRIEILVILANVQKSCFRLFHIIDPLWLIKEFFGKKY